MQITDGTTSRPLATLVAALTLAGCHGGNGPAGLSDAGPSDAGAADAIISSAGRFSAVATSSFGSFGGIEYVRITGRFSGTTSLGDFRVPFEIVAPADPGRGNGVVLVEPPHFAFGPIGRESVLGRELLFGDGFSYAAVGFGANGLNILDPAATDALIAGEPVESPGSLKFGLPPDEGIIVEFVDALTTEPFAVQTLGPVDHVYAYGVSQTAAALLETLLSPGGRGLFDLTLLHAALWRPLFAVGEFERSEGEFEPLSGVGRVVFVGSEGDQIVSDAEQFRRAAHLPDYRVYEVAGAAHQPTPANPLDHGAVMRAIAGAADRWVREGVEPPPSRLLREAPPGEVDPVYGFVTGIARDGDLNARGGVQLPDLRVGRARFIAVDFSVPGLPLTGTSINLSCEPRPGAASRPGRPHATSRHAPRFRNHGEYVSAFTRQANRLVEAGFLLRVDAERLTGAAAKSGVGKPGTCPGVIQSPH